MTTTNEVDKRQKWPRWFEIARRLHAAVVNFYPENSQALEKDDNRLIKDNVPLEEATAIGSKVESWIRDQHQIMFDLDIPHVYLPSTTEGHGHLIFSKQVSWEKYMDLMRAMVDCDLVERGYYNVCLNRGEAWLRTPWTAKGMDGNVPE